MSSLSACSFIFAVAFFQLLKGLVIHVPPVLGDIVDQDVKQFVDKAGKYAHCTSKDSVVDFVEALGTWVDESFLARLQNAHYFTLQ